MFLVSSLGSHRSTWGPPGGFGHLFLVQTVILLEPEVQGKRCLGGVGSGLCVPSHLTSTGSDVVFPQAWSALDFPPSTCQRAMLWHQHQVWMRRSKTLWIPRVQASKLQPLASRIWTQSWWDVCYSLLGSNAMDQGSEKLRKTWRRWHPRPHSHRSPLHSRIFLGVFTSSFSPHYYFSPIFSYSVFLFLLFMHFPLGFSKNAQKTLDIQRWWFLALDQWFFFF